MTDTTAMQGHGRTSVWDHSRIGRLERRFSPPGDPYHGIEWERRTASLTSYRDGAEIFRQDTVEVPSFWSETSTRILAEKYFRGHLGEPDRESSLRQVIDRIVSTITRAGVDHGYFLDDEEAQVFSDELTWLLAHQRGAFNSPVWFNVGVAGVPQQVSACFLLDVDDDMEEILNWYVEEGLIFKGGSGAGVNLSKIRSRREKLRGGGTPSGPVSFMRGADASAGTISSGGRNRRAAKMVMLDVDHPDVRDFIWVKAREERKIRALAEAGFDMSVDGADITSVQYQNANNSVRVTDDFMEAVVQDGPWDLVARTTGDVVETVRARELFSEICKAAWECADPGILFDTTINRWNTVEASGRITTTNPCAEYHHLENTSCNLASINLLTFLDDDGVFDVEGFVHACSVFFFAQEICISFADYPTRKIAEGTRRFREIGLGYANLGGVLMAMGLPYDSNEGRAFAAAVTAALTGAGYAQSAEIAERVGPFEGFGENRASMIKVLEMHRDHVRADARDERPYAAVPEGALGGGVVRQLQAVAEQLFDAAVEGAVAHGVRNSQCSVVAPTGTVALLMGCDTTSCEPAIGLTSTKKMVGGGTMSFAVGVVGRALRALGYSTAAIDQIAAHVANYGSVIGAPALLSEHYPVFATALGDNVVSAEGHVRMLAAIQPYLSGAASKTVNLPSTATVEDIENLTLQAWRDGVKCIAIYRDGSKGAQPLSAGKGDGATASEPEGRPEPVRERLPRHRRSQTFAFDVGGCEGYITVGEYPDGRPGEVFVKVSKQGSTLSGVMDAFSIAVSLGLQYGVPLKVYVAKYSNSKFEPAGITDDPEIRLAASLVDYVCRRLAISYLSADDREELGIYTTAERTEQVNGNGHANGNGLHAGNGATSHGAPVKDSDAPLCGTCGSLTYRNGACHTCFTCGSVSGGCS